MRSFTNLSFFLLCSTLLMESSSAFSSSSSAVTSLHHHHKFASAPRLPPLRVSAIPQTGDSAATAMDDSSSSNKKSYQNMPPGTHAPVVDIHSPEELSAFLNQDDRITVIKFHAAWCKSCQRFGHKYQGLANAKTDWVSSKDDEVVREGSVRFASIEYGANMALCKSLGIKKLPTVHIYQKGKGQLDAFPCGPKKFAMLVERLEHHLSNTSAVVSTDTARSGSADATQQQQQHQPSEQQPSDNQSEVLAALKRAQEILAENKHTNDSRDIDNNNNNHRVQVDSESNKNHDSMEAEMAAIFEELMIEEKGQGSDSKSKKKWWKYIMP